MHPQLLVAGLLVAAVSGRLVPANVEPGVPLSENFDEVTAPALPYGWIATSPQGPDGKWLTDTTNPDTAPNAAHVADPSVYANRMLDSPPVWITTSSAQLTFRHNYYLTSYPGGGNPQDPQGSNSTPDGFYIYTTQAILNISVGGSDFQNILDAGGSFVTGAYNAGTFWGGSNQSYSQVVVNLPSAAAGTTVVLRWQLSSVAPPPGFGGSGWWVDSIQICDGYPCDASPQPIRLDVDTAGNGVWEPGETVDVSPAYGNLGSTELLLTGTASGLTGPGGATYGIVDSAASYDIPPGVQGSCVDTGDCYSVSVDAPTARPAQHWDATLQEALTNGLDVTWVVHIGGSFLDVPTSNQFYSDIETVFHNGVTGGCSGGGYCPDASTLRKQMAVLVLKAKYGRSYVPTPCVGVFTDVPCPGPFTDWIEDLHTQGVVAGCGSGAAYCPDDPVSRQQMSVFLLKTLMGANYVPPSCQGVFPDVPCSNPFAPWIEDLYSRQIAAGCGGGNYCPTNATARGQMAPFLVKTFGLLLYGP